MNGRLDRKKSVTLKAKTLGDKTHCPPPLQFTEFTCFLADIFACQCRIFMKICTDLYHLASGEKGKSRFFLLNSERWKLLIWGKTSLSFFKCFNFIRETSQIQQVWIDYVSLLFVVLSLNLNIRLHCFNCEKYLKNIFLKERSTQTKPSVALWN